ncbi:MAG TPA: hypothetical protein VFE05_24180 [Longimicrobiaceae bacterium]|jgi:hypothetical protein|nr:hypothetical protein [Longimicrobiaceae bacterium]
MTRVQHPVAPEHRGLFTDTTALGKALHKLAHTRDEWVMHRCKSAAGRAFGAVGGVAGAVAVYGAAGAPAPMLVGTLVGVTVGMLLAVKWSWDEWMGAKQDYPMLLLHDEFAIDPLMAWREEWAEWTEGRTGIAVWWADHRLVPAHSRGVVVVMDGSVLGGRRARDRPGWAELRPGSHTVNVQLGPLRSAELRVEVAPGERVETGARYVLSGAGEGSLVLEVLPPVGAMTEGRADPASPHGAGHG